VGIVGLSLAAARGGAAAACPSTCTQELRECKRTCASGGQARRDCRAACAERSTCTAPGAHIHTLAYVTTECTTDPQKRSSLKQTLFVRHGNCDPVPVAAFGPSRPVTTPFADTCIYYGLSRNGWFFTSAAGRSVGVFQNVGVLRDGSTVFNLTKQFSNVPALTPDVPEEGIFVVRADGSEPRRLGPPSRAPQLFSFRWSVSPDGRTIAFIDLGDAKEPPYYEAPQVFLLDPRRNRRKQLTHQPRRPNLTNGDNGVTLPIFLNKRTIAYYSGSTDTELRAYQVTTDGKESALGTFITADGAQIVARFEVTGGSPHEVLGLFPNEPSVNTPGRFAREAFLVDGKNLVQLTNFHRSDTIPGGLGGAGLFVRGRMLLLATANDTGENPHELCQLFSIDTLGTPSSLRQLTHLPFDGRPSSSLGCVYEPPGCGIVTLSTAADGPTGTVLFSASCDPVGANPFGDQIFAMRPDGTGLRQLTNARGMTIDPDGTVHVELPGPFAYPRRGPG
jgi:hypothetical protein